MASLPDKDSPELHLVVATAEEHYAQTHANSDEWRGALSLPAYFRREEHLLNQDLTKNGGLTPWLLVHQPAGTSKNDRKVLCGCETIKKTALAAVNGKVQDETAHGVASVFCPPQFRGKGYAGRMMAELGEKLKGWQVKDQPALFSVLWSDIGKDFYAARGWKAFPSSHISLAAGHQPPSSLPQSKPLKAADLPALCDSDSQSLRSQLSNAAKPTVALLPNVATLAWHHAREEFIAKELYNRNPETKGALVEIAPGRRAWCVWTRVWTNPDDDDANTLHILRLAIEGDAAQDFAPASEDGVVNVQGSPVVDAIAALFAAAQREAAEWEMEAVEFWNPTSVVLAAARKIDAHSKVHEREKASICSLRWYGEGDGEDLQWVCNEKYGWC